MNRRNFIENSAPNSKNIKNDKTKKPIMPNFVLYIEYTFIHFGMSISCKQGSLLISKNFMCMRGETEKNQISFSIEPISANPRIVLCSVVYR
jgi:hypothetical protein